MTTLHTQIYDGQFVKITYGIDETQGRNTYKIHIQHQASDVGDGRTLARDLDGAASAIREHQSGKNARA